MVKPLQFCIALPLLSYGNYYTEFVFFCVDREKYMGYSINDSVSGAI